MFLIILGVLMLIGLVILHELGHFWAARKSGVEVEEFGIGFPPKAKSLGKKNGTEYTLNWLPLGGFVKLKGEHDSDTTKGSFGAAKLADKVKIMVAGVVVNAITAVLLMTVVAAAGMPQFLDNQFTVASDTTTSQYDIVAVFVAEDSPAYNAGLRDGDVLRGILDDEDCLDDCRGYSLSAPEDLGDVTKELAGRRVSVLFEPGNNSIFLEDATDILRQEDEAITSQLRDVNLQLRSVEEVEQSRSEREMCLVDFSDGDEECAFTKGHLGVVASDYVETRSTWSAPIVATVVSGQIVHETFKNLGGIIGDLFKGDTTAASEQVTGVVGIGYILGELSSQGFVSVLFLIAVISLSLAVMNILPIPALDGGRLFVTLLFRALNKPLTKETEEKIHGTGFMLLMLLFVLITVVDVQRFIL